MINPYEMLGETIRSMTKVSYEIEKMPESIAAHFFDVEQGPEVLGESVMKQFGTKVAETTPETHLGTTMMQTEVTAPKETESILSEQNQDEARATIDRIHSEMVGQPCIISDDFTLAA